MGSNQVEGSFLYFFLLTKADLFLSFFLLFIVLSFGNSVLKKRTEERKTKREICRMAKRRGVFVPLSHASLPAPSVV